MTLCFAADLHCGRISLSAPLYHHAQTPCIRRRILSVTLLCHVHTSAHNNRIICCCGETGTTYKDLQVAYILTSCWKSFLFALKKPLRTGLKTTWRKRYIFSISSIAAEIQAMKMIAGEHYVGLYVK